MSEETRQHFVEERGKIVRLELSQHALLGGACYEDAVLVSLLDLDHPRVPVDDDFDHALWQLRGHGLVGWQEGRGRPDYTLTPEGRALAERLVAGGA